MSLEKMWLHLNKFIHALIRYLGGKCYPIICLHSRVFKTSLLKFQAAVYGIRNLHSSFRQSGITGWILMSDNSIWLGYSQRKHIWLFGCVSVWVGGERKCHFLVFSKRPLNSLQNWKCKLWPDKTFTHRILIKTC